MKIQPNPSGPNSGATDRVTHGRTRTGEGTRRGRGETAPGSPGDDVQISPEARDLQPISAGAPDPALAGARLREVLDRVAGGFYDQPEVVDAVVQRLRKDL